MPEKNFQVRRNKNDYSVYHKGAVVAKYTPEDLKGVMLALARTNLTPKRYLVFTKLLSALIDVDGVKKKRRTVRKKIDRKTEIRAVQFSKKYCLMGKKFYKQKILKEIDSEHKDFKHFVLALPIIDAHKVTYEKYIKAQIEGLSFLNDKAGSFPRPCHLSTHSAELRLLDYIKQNGKGDEPPVKVHISQYERELPISQNMTYFGYMDRIKEGIATLEEAVYVREIQRIRNNKITPTSKIVDRYIKKLLKRKKLIKNGD